jgi:hypothetical protein
VAQNADRGYILCLVRGGHRGQRRLLQKETRVKTSVSTPVGLHPRPSKHITFENSNPTRVYVSAISQLIQSVNSVERRLAGRAETVMQSWRHRGAESSTSLHKGISPSFGLLHEFFR